MVKKEDRALDLIELLPELSEEAMEKVIGLVSTIINEEVEARHKVLESRVMGFIRGEIDLLKDQAVRELDEENSTFRDASRMKALRTFMSMELDGDDERTAVGHAVSENTALLEENQLLVQEVDNTITRLNQLETSNEALADRLTALDEENSQLKSEIQALEDSSKTLDEEGVTSSERAIMVRAPEVAKVELVEGTQEDNGEALPEFVTRDAMRLMPQNDD